MEQKSFLQLCTDVFKINGFYKHNKNYYKEYGNQEDRELEEIIRPKSLKCLCDRDANATAEILYSDYYPTFVETTYRCECGRYLAARQFRKFPHPKTEKEQEDDDGGKDTQTSHR